MTSWALALTLAVVAAPRGGDAPTERFALVVGANTGTAFDPPLRYAEADASNVAALLTDVGDVPKGNVVLLQKPTADALRERFADFKERIAAERASGNNVLFFVYYSGHADALAMHLAGTTLPWFELLQLAHQTTATTRLIVVDACRAGELTRVKGAHRVAPFLVPTRDDAMPQGLAILASSSANESSQESDSLHGSLFTHHFIEALRGAADRNADGRVTLNEAFEYTADSTAFTSAQTEEGLQHATFRYRLQGRADMTLTRPVTSSAMAFLNIRDAGEYRFTMGDSSGPLVLDAVVDEGGRSVTLPAGRYFVQARTPSALRQGLVTVAGRRTTILESTTLPSVELTPLALKGGDDGAVAEPTPKLYAVNVGAGLGTALMPGFSVPWQVNVLGTRQFTHILVDVQLRVDHSSGQNNALSTSLTELGAAAGVRGFTHAGPVVLSLGSRAGLVWLDQAYSGANAPGSRWQIAPQLQAVARADMNFTANFSIGLEAGAQAMVLTRDVTTTGASSTWIQVRPFATFNLGWHW